MSWKDVLKLPLVRKYQKAYHEQLKACRGNFEEYMNKQRGAEETVLQSLLEEKYKEINEIADDLLFLKWKDGYAEKNTSLTFARYFYANPQAVVAYCDEASDNMDIPDYKPDWSPDLFLQRFYFSGLIAVRKSALQSAPVLQFDFSVTERIPKVELWNTIYQIIKVKGGFNKNKSGKNVVLHIPQVLFWHQTNSEEDLDDSITHEILKTDSGIGEEKKVTDERIDVSIIIPSKDHPELLKTCIQSVYNTVRNLKIEIIVVDNGSSEENCRKINGLAEEYKFTYLYQKMPFHFSKMCNYGAENAKGKHLLFLNDDIECINSGWLEEMYEVTTRPYVGAVGSKLLYPDGQRIQHAGITNLPIGPVHKLQFLEDDEIYYDNYNRGMRNVLAVTGACLMVRRELFEECGGMSEDLVVAFNDVELCFRLYEKGYYQVVLQDKPLYHHESLSRGDDESAEKWQRLMQERKKLYQLHPDLEGKDPFYNIHLNRKGLDTRIIPGYMQGKQKLEVVGPVLWKNGIPADAKEDKCLLVRAEICKDVSTVIELSGYGVVLGSDNALFNKELLLRRVKNETNTPVIYKLSFGGQYRSDLENNMSDQVNVALSGFWVSFEKTMLLKGEYEVGMYATDRVSRTKLYCFTSRRVTIE